MKRIVIHVGLPKTGTTFLQENVFALLPEDQCAYNPGNLLRILIDMCKQVLVQGELRPNELSELKRKVDDAIAHLEAETLLISIEALLPAHCGGLARAENILRVLQQLIENPVVIIFLREQSAWIRSGYSFCLVSKYIMPFDEFVNRTPDGGFGKRATEDLGVSVYDCDHQSVRQMTEKHFNRVVCLSFEDLFSKQEFVLARLAEELGVATLDVKASQKVNEGLAERLMVIVSRVVRHIPWRSKWRADYLHVRYAKLGLLETIAYIYLKRAGQVSMAIARVLYQYTNYAKGVRLFSSLDEACIKDYYLEKNADFWSDAAHATTPDLP